MVMTGAMMVMISSLYDNGKGARLDLLFGKDDSSHDAKSPYCRR